MWFTIIDDLNKDMHEEKNEQEIKQGLNIMIFYVLNKNNDVMMYIVAAIIDIITTST